MSFRTRAAILAKQQAEAEQSQPRDAWAGIPPAHKPPQAVPGTIAGWAVVTLGPMGRLSGLTSASLLSESEARSEARAWWRGEDRRRVAVCQVVVTEVCPK